VETEWTAAFTSLLQRWKDGKKDKMTKDLRRYYIKEMFVNLERLKTDGIWLNGFQGEGEYKEWDNDGQLWIRCFYKNGKRHGEFKKWSYNRRLYVHCFYKNGVVVKTIK